MPIESVIRAHKLSIVTVVAAVPFGACAVLAVFRDSFAATDAGLVLVLLIVAAASTGMRPVGLVASVGAAAGFDFFLTEPYNTFAITDRSDIETTVLLLLIGVAVSEIAMWGHRVQASVARERGYLDGVISAVGTVAAGKSSRDEFIDQICMRIVDLLGADRCRFDPETRTGLPVLDPSGTLTRRGRQIDVVRHGLPTDTSIAIPLANGGTGRGHLELTTSTRVVKPSRTRLRTAVALATQIGMLDAKDLDPETQPTTRTRQ